MRGRPAAGAGLEAAPSCFWALRGWASLSGSRGKYPDLSAVYYALVNVTLRLSQAIGVSSYAGSLLHFVVLPVLFTAGYGGLQVWLANRKPIASAGSSEAPSEPSTAVSFSDALHDWRLWNVRAIGAGVFAGGLALVPAIEVLVSATDLSLTYTYWGHGGATSTPYRANTVLGHLRNLGLSGASLGIGLVSLSLFTGLRRAGDVYRATTPGRLGPPPARRRHQAGTVTSFTLALVPTRSFLRRHRSVLAAVAGLAMVGALVVQTVPFARMAWASLTGGPGMGLVQDVRESLLEQEGFREALAAHEREALRFHQRAGREALQKRHLVKVNLAPFGLPGFRDVFAVRVRTDVVGGTPYTSFLARPGVVASPADAPWFSRQCDGALCRQAFELAVGAYHGALEMGLFTPYRLNVTESDRTSSVSID